HYVEDEWVAIAPQNCVLDLPWDEDFAHGVIPDREAACEEYPLVGYDSNYENLWWMVADRDVEIALINK
ncbi:hypothetical protein AB4574_28010, partial [Vibrio sp. 10N.222.49.E5]